MADELVEETGIPALDDFLYGLVNILQIGYRPHLRAILLIGSYAHGGYRADSDVDLCLLLKTGPDIAVRRQRIWSIATHYMRCTPFHADPMWNHLETPFYTEDEIVDPGYTPCSAILRLAVKEHSRLLWGEDVRPRVLLQGAGDLRRQVLNSALYGIARPHGVKTDGCSAVLEPLPYPLADPEPAGDDHWSLPRLIKRSIELARARILLETGEFIFRKDTVLKVFERTIDSPWTELMHAIHRAAYEELTDAERQALESAVKCRMTAFENWFLEGLLQNEVMLTVEIVT